MRRTILILAACLVLVVGMTGCDDDDDLIIDPVTQGVTAATQGVVTTVSTVTSLAGVFAPAPPAAQTAVLGDPCTKGFTDVSTDVCLGGGSANLCESELFLDLASCNIPGVGVLDGMPAFFQSGPFAIGVGVTVDGDTFISGTLGLALNEAQGEKGCFVFDYDLNVSGGSSSTIVGVITGCPDGSIFGAPNVVISDLNLNLFFFFEGTSATIQVFDLLTQENLAFCTVSPLDGVPICDSGITKG